MSDELQIVEYEGIRVLTSRQIAEMYGTDSKTISKNFNRNKDRYTEGKHYFLLKGKELRSFLQNDENISKAPKLYLWTKKGAFHHAKSLNTDIAWEVYERLVDFYFEVQSEKEEFNPPIEKFPETTPRVTFQTSDTKLPRNPSWYARNKRRIENICENAKCTVSTLYHNILLRLGEEYNLDGVNEIYLKETGHYPKFPMDVVNYFSELAHMADAYLDKVEELVENQNK